MPAGLSRIAASANAPMAAIADRAAPFYGDAVPPRSGAHAGRRQADLAQFRAQDRRLQRRLDDGRIPGRGNRAISAQVGAGRVICGLSGGVDSAVAAVLIHEAIGERLTCVFVDHGLLRLGEAEEVVGLFRGHYNIPLVHVEAGELFLGALTGVTDPEEKRKIIGRLFIDDVRARGQRDRRRRTGMPEFLAQGTLYPDVIESVSFSGGPSVTIKSHHNVGGFPSA